MDGGGDLRCVDGFHAVENFTLRDVRFRAHGDNRAFTVSNANGRRDGTGGRGNFLHGVELAALTRIACNAFHLAVFNSDGQRAAQGAVDADKRFRFHSNALLIPLPP